MSLYQLTICEARCLLKQREIQPIELIQSCLERISRIDPILNCFITLADTTPVKDLTATGHKKGAPLMGIPLALKDLYETEGIRTTAGSTFFANHIPEQDAEAVRKLKHAGAVLLGKLNMHEIALGVTNVNPHFGACRNPWDQQRITGGSSGGSAAALAADLILGSLGSDSGGSIRIPASLCGIVGLKPTYGRVSLRGVIPLSWNTDHAGPMAKTVEDLAILLQVIAGYDPLDAYSIRAPRLDALSTLKQGIRGWRIALADDEYIHYSDSEVLSMVQEAARAFELLGASVEMIPFPGMYSAAQANLLMVTSDAAAYHHERLQSYPEGFGADVLHRLQAGAAYTSTAYILARHTQTILRRQFEQFFENYDILVTPTTPVVAPPIEGPDAVEQARLLTRFTAPFNLTGLPALSLPCGFNTSGLPVGMQLISRPWAESALLQAAYAYEQATIWHTRRPVLEAY